MRTVQWLSILATAGLLAAASAAQAQSRPYIGYVYPAGGQQGSTFQIKLGGQGMEDITGVAVSGGGVTAKLVDYQRKLGPTDMTLLGEQMRELRRNMPRGISLAALTSSGDAMMSSGSAATSSGDAMMMPSSDLITSRAKALGVKDPALLTLMARIEKRQREYVNRPACQSISSIAYLELTVARDAKPGQRELRLTTLRGMSNPLVFHVGQVPETCRKPMITAEFQVLGKEELAQRKRPPEEAEVRITVPCTVNGQIASGEVNHYRFQALKGQRLVISTQARQLIPYIADAVPGWFQPVLTLYDAKGKELAYDDDYRFKPDPVIFYEVPQDGEYVFTINDAIYRGREDFVYRITIGETPFITSIFPFGARLGETPKIDMKGWNLPKIDLVPPARTAGTGVQLIGAAKKNMISNRVPFAVDNLPEIFDKEPNNNQARAQKVTLPVSINGRIDREDDWDVYQVWGRAGETIVAEVYARRLDSPLDSVLKITDSSGKVLAMNDDHEDAGAGTNTHDADSYLMFKLPADGNYFVQVGDTARNGGEEYAYRLRISAPRPDFALRVVPSSLSMRSRGSNTVTVYAIRKDGFTGPIKLGVREPVGFSVSWASLSGTQTSTRITIKTSLVSTPQPVALFVEGQATIDGRSVAHDAVGAEDRMQAFLWRHLVPAQEFKVLVFDPSYEPPTKRVPRVQPSMTVETKPKPPTTNDPSKAKFSKKQVAGRLHQLKVLFEDGLLTDQFYEGKVAECETAQ